MNEVFTLRYILTSGFAKGVTVLTLVLGFLSPHNLYAATDDNLPFASVASEQAADTPLESLDREQQLAFLRAYVRKEILGWTPGLQDNLRGPVNWAKNNWQSAQQSLGLDGEEDGGNGGAELGKELRQSVSPGTSRAFWMTPDYHHKGFFPIHDAMKMDFNMRQHMFGDRLQIDTSPFYGQNWMSLRGYEGAELGIGMKSNGASQPWGRVVLRYTEGDQTLMDHGHGIDMHADLHFDENFGLRAGVREDESTQLGNYVMVRWKLTDFGR